MKPPVNTARRRKAARSSSASRSWLQSRVPRRAWCRSGAERDPPTRTVNTSSSRSASWPAERMRIRAAASSIASGSPSTRRHTCSTAAALSPVSRNDGSTSCARCSKSRTASYPASSDTVGAGPSWGSESGGTGQFRSPSTPSTSRLVARMDRAGQTPRSRSARPPAAAVRCSQLSRMSSSDESPTCSAILSAASRPRLSGTPSRAATVSPTMAGSSSGASSVQHAPAEKDGPAALATARASRVFPVPPGPVSVSSRLRGRLSSTSRSSRCRPTSGTSRDGSRPVFSAAATCPAPPLGPRQHPPSLECRWPTAWSGPARGRGPPLLSTNRGQWPQPCDRLTGSGLVLGRCPGMGAIHQAGRQRSAWRLDAAEQVRMRRRAERRTS